MTVSPLTCTAEELFTVVAGTNATQLRLSLSNPAMSENHLVTLLRNPHVTEEVVRLIVERQDWLSSYKVQMAIVSCPKTPFPIAMRLIPLLYWNDLLKVIANYRINPRLRRAGEKYLQEKLAALTLGEKISIARTGPRPVIALLRKEKEKRILEALLRNPHMKEEDLLPVLNDQQTRVDVLETIGRDQKWSLRYSVRLALVRNHQTPLALALSFLSRLKKNDLEGLVSAPDTRELLRRAAARILSGEY